MLPTLRATAQKNFAEGVDLGPIENDAINEASGLAAGRNSPGILWTHNDSGDSARVFAIDTLGKDRGEWILNGATNRDWEDIAVGPGPEEGISYIYVGEIGDNNAQYPTKRIYRVPEPKVAVTDAPRRHELDGVETITVEYPDGARDAETLLIDPVTRDLFIVSKRESSVRVYRAPYPQSTTETIRLEHVLTLEEKTFITGGDISPDGSGILLKDYTAAYLWKREPKTTVGEAFAGSFSPVPYTLEPQGEAIAWSRDGTAYYTISEEAAGIETHLHVYRRIGSTTSVEDHGNAEDGKEGPDLAKEKE